MEPILGIVGVLLLIAIIGGGTFLKSYLNSKAQSAGEAIGRNVSSKRLPGVLAQFGEDLIIHAPLEVAKDVVGGAMAKKPKRYSTGADGTYRVLGIDKDSTTATLVAEGSSTVFRVLSFRDGLGFPQGVVYVNELRTHIRELATARGIAVSTAGPTEYSRQDRIDDNNWLWKVKDPNQSQFQFGQGV